MNEKLLQAGIVRHLREVQGLPVYEFGKPGGHGPLAGSVPAGWPDTLVIVSPNRINKAPCPRPLHIYFEIKTMQGKVLLEQAQMHTELRELGVPVMVVQSDDVEVAIRMIESVLRDQGVMLRKWQ